LALSVQIKNGGNKKITMCYDLDLFSSAGVFGLPAFGKWRVA